jgi:hypothetical protein
MRITGCRVDGVVLQELRVDAESMSFTATTVLTLDGRPALTATTGGIMPDEVQKAWGVFAAVVEKSMAEVLGASEQKEDKNQSIPKSLVKI